MNRQDRRRRQASARRAGAPSPQSAGAGGGAAQVLIARALAAHRAGRLAEAEAFYRQILAAAPDQPDTLHALALLHQQRGQGREAAALLERAVAARPRSAELLTDLGSVRWTLGEIEEAAARFAEAIAAEPRFAAAHYNLGLVHMKRGEPARALGCFETAVRLAPGHLQAQLMLGNALDDLGRGEEAIAQYRKLVALAPGFAQGWYNLGLSLKAKGRFAEAAHAFERTIALNPRMAAAYNNLGTTLLKLERPEDARTCFERALALDPDSAEAHNNMGVALRDEQRLDEAAERFRKAIALRPGYADALTNLGTVYLNQGKFDEADACFEQSLALQPENVAAIGGTLFASSARLTEETAERIERMLAAGGLPAAHRCALHFALGRIYDAQGDYPRAFANFERGHSLAGGAEAFDPDFWRGRVETAMRVFDRDFFAKRRGWGNPSDVPVFIVGMPRSGTTLTEQILASHPAVAGAGELPHIREAAMGLDKRFGLSAPYPECAAAIGPDSVRELAQDYLALLMKGREGAARVTDKMPGNFFHLGFIALLFPNARLIHCRRDPRDNCLSCYVTRFGQPHPYTHDLRNLGLYYREHERLMAHWREVLPVPVLEVRYEELVERQEEVSRRILAHCGLDWDPRCLEFHKAERPVFTASVAQVRRPMYTSSVGRWRNYEPYLAPLREALGEA